MTPGIPQYNTAHHQPCGCSGERPSIGGAIKKVALLATAILFWSGAVLAASISTFAPNMIFVAIALGVSGAVITDTALTNSHSIQTCYAHRRPFFFYDRGPSFFHLLHSISAPSRRSHTRFHRPPVSGIRTEFTNGRGCAHRPPVRR